jgi:hypothetical protein
MAVSYSEMNGSKTSGRRLIRATRATIGTSNQPGYETRYTSGAGDRRSAQISRG